MNKKTIIAALLGVTAMLPAAHAAESHAAEPVRVPVFEMNTDGSRYYRIPALAVAADGSLIAVADKRGDALNDLPNTISVIARRSTDNGDTWSEAVTLAQGDKATGKTYGDPAVVVDRVTGAIIVLFCGDRGFWDSRHAPSLRQGLYMVRSTDNGMTWSEPVRFDSQIYKLNWQGAFVASGSATQLANGRIMCVVNAHTSTSAGNNQEQYAIWTDDLGETWHAGRYPATPAGNGNESKLLELEDGSLLMSIRWPGVRTYARSTDGGDSWSALDSWSDMRSADCNGDIVRYSGTGDGQSRILHSVPNSSIRENVSVFLSYDEARTWPVRKTLYPGYSAYSSLAVLPDGQVGCLVEEGKWDSNLPGQDGFNIAFYRFGIDWLTDGEDDPATVSMVSDEAAVVPEAMYTLTGVRVDRNTATPGLYVLRTATDARLTVVR